MPRRAILLAFALLPATTASAEWRMADVDPLAIATVEAEPSGDNPRATLAISCLRGTSTDTFSLEASLPVPRAATALPRNTTREVLRLGPFCPGPIEPPRPPGSPAALRLRVSGELIETRARISERFRRLEPAVNGRQDGPCEIATFALDPATALLIVEGGGETRSRYLVELLRAEHAGEVEVTLPEHGVTQRFPIAGAAGVLSALRRVCGWED